MPKLESLARRLVLVWGLALGCAEGPGGPATTMPPPEPDLADPAMVYSALTTDMERLNALSIVHARSLVIDVPAGGQSSACYSLHPCEAVSTLPEVSAEYARQAPRLRRLTSIAEGAAANAYPAGGEFDTPADLAALRDLRIIEFGELLTVAPDTSRTCYGLPCSDEVARAAAENNRRAAVLHGIVTAASADEGL